MSDALGSAKRKIPSTSRKDPLPDATREPAESIEDIWAPAAEIATVGIFLMLAGACLYFCRPVLLPVTAALVVGTTLAPLVKAVARYRVPPWVTAGVLAVALVAATGAAVTFLARPAADWIAKAPEIGAVIKQKLYVLDPLLSALHDFQEVVLPSSKSAVAVESSQLALVTPVLAVVTPAAVEMVLFFVTLIFFLAAQIDFRRYMVSFFRTRAGKLRFIRIATDVEQHLASYLIVVTCINFCLGVAVALGAWLYGFASPLVFGLLAMVLNYIPYIGAACMTLILFGVGLLSLPTLTLAFGPPAAFVALATVEGQFITPAVLGHRLTLNPMVVILALAFWSWIWGPMGTFLAVPLTIIALVTLQHLFPPDESKLPG